MISMGVYQRKTAKIILIALTKVWVVTPK